MLQSCLTLGDPIDGSPPGPPPRPWDSPGKDTGVGCHFQSSNGRDGELTGLTLTSLMGFAYESSAGWIGMGTQERTKWAFPAAVATPESAYSQQADSS